MKYLLALLMPMMAVCACLAQKQNVYFLKSNGKQVSIRDSADFIHIVREPDSASTLYNVLDYYLSGKLKMMGKSSTIFPSMLEGISVTYFENGNRKNISEYKKGNLVHKQYLYYPNGRRYTVFDYADLPKTSTAFKFPPMIVECKDSTGVSLVTDGVGYYRGYNENFSRVVEEGQVKNNKREGLWKGYEEAINVSFTETYSNGELIKGLSTSDTNDTVSYTKSRMVIPQFKGGIDAFYRYLGMSIRYPNNARINGIQGRVVLGFIIQKDGKLTDIQVLSSAGQALDEEAVRVTKASPKWIAGTVCGRNVRVSHSIPIIFTLQ
ncbi:energy transducer TonB [Mucilaginibacter lacusdianchii]|uniref:energy transducer TonB n=1 Tax=Mucilaginibacter lacusdianchii TaxID=2684211 RepID=UPI00131E208F|nr:energy transducer TonB [Mucilaginibacter sp. JXJ CY 39]